ncbi:MAG: ABC transporter ATP-binding protein/permease [Planctomycetes bacterium]|nr:ABC transporter ATP-binding protein/permease [Planctomycetota bacterium]
MRRTLADCSWPAARLGDAVEALALRSGFGGATSRLAGRTDDVPEAWFDDVDGPLDAWIASAAVRTGAEAEAVQCAASELSHAVRRLAPAVAAFREADGALRIVAIVRSRGGDVELLLPDQGTARVRSRDLAEGLRRAVAEPLEREAAKLVEIAGVPEAKRARVLRGLADRMAAKKPVRGMWLLRPGPGAPLAAQSREDRLGRLGVLLVGAHAAQYALWIASWALLGRAAFAGRIEPGWIAAWGLVLLAMLPFRVLDTLAGGRLAQRAGAMLRRRMLQGALRLDPEEIRHEGVGSLLGQAMETDVIEQTAVSGAQLSVTSSVELVFAIAVLALGAGGIGHAALLVLWIAVAAFIAWRALVARREWTDTRLKLTNDLVERMVGHRTRVAQLQPERRHDGEDPAVDAYFAASKRLDAHAVRLEALLPRAWLILGLAGAAPAFVGRAGSDGGDVGGLAVALGGVFLAYQAFRGLGLGLDRAIGARVAWERVRDLWRAATRPSLPGVPGFAARATPLATVLATSGLRPVVLEAHGVTLTHRSRATPVLRGLDLEIREGDRILLEGGSGAGKSSLAMLLSGCKRPDAGLLLLRGLDIGTLGEEAWRRRAVIAPQFHENHVILGPLSFNLLLGRRWPAEEKDLREADAVCRGLGLGPVLDRMPGGLQQLVGETGWQMSHGEQSRVFLARTLLQGADVVFLDETFAALDPETFARCVDYVKSRAPALVVIAHR